MADLLRTHRDILTVFLPELAPLFDFDQKNPHHCYDVWEHTLHAMANIAPDPTLRLAMLFHDLGKLATFTLDEQGEGHCNGHSAVSAAMAREILSRLRCDRETSDAVVTLVAWHDGCGSSAAVPPCACWSSWARSVCGSCCWWRRRTSKPKRRRRCRGRWSS